MTALKILSRCLVIIILSLIFVGALVTSHDAGLSVPDWPTTFEENMFTYSYSKWVGGIFFEHGHRLFASIVGFLTLLLAGIAWIKEPRKYVRFWSYLALAAVIMQGILGGMTVIYGLPDAISISHALLSQTFLLIITTIAFFYSGKWESSKAFVIGQNKVSRQAAWCIAFLYMQLLLGALVRHTGSALAIPDFPTTAGNLLPLVNDQVLSTINAWRESQALQAVTSSQVWFQLMHRAGAIIVFVAIIKLLMHLKRSSDRYLRALRLVILPLITAQVVLGASVIWSVREPWITSFHVVIGAAILVSTYVALLLSSSQDELI